MATPMLMKVACMAMMISVVLGVIPMAYGAIPCGQAQFTVAPCLGYLRGPGGPPPGQCCSGLRTLYSQARTVPDRQDLCRCLKSTVVSIPGLNVATLAGTAGKCGINLPYKVTPSINCNTIP